jgi:predicted RNA binding protein YcfA (HicA-like mRNA interferase family)
VSYWPSSKARQVYSALTGIGWSPKAFKSGSHVTLQRQGWEDYTWAFHDGEELGPKILARIAKKTGLKPSDL